MTMNVLAQPTSCCCNFLLLSQKIIFVIGVIDAFKNSEDIPTDTPVCMYVRMYSTCKVAEVGAIRNLF